MLLFKKIIKILKELFSLKAEPNLDNNITTINKNTQIHKPATRIKIFKLNINPPKLKNKWKKGAIYRVWNKMGTSVPIYLFEINCGSFFKEIPKLKTVGEIKNNEIVMFLEFKILPTLKHKIDDKIKFKFPSKLTVGSEIFIPFCEEDLEISFDSEEDWYYKVIHNDQIGYIVGTYTDLLSITEKEVKKQYRKKLYK